MFETKGIEKNHNAHFMISDFFLVQKSCHLWDNVEKYGKNQTGFRWQYSTCAFHAG